MGRTVQDGADHEGDESCLDRVEHERKVPRRGEEKQTGAARHAKQHEAPARANQSGRKGVNEHR